MASYSDTIEMVVGDTKPVLTFTIRDSNTAASGQTLDENIPTTWAPMDLTGATVRLHIRKTGSTTLKETRTCSAADAANGQFTTDFATTTFDTSGQYEAEIEITYADSGIQTVQDFLKFKVRDQIA